MGRPGFEPGTNRLKAEYSTVELATLLRFSTFPLYHHEMGVCQGAEKRFAVNRTEAVQLAPGANTVRFSPVFRELRGAVHGSRQ